MNFELSADFSPTGDQPQAISELIKGLKQGKKSQTLLGVTGSGKTFTIANVIENINRPTLVLSHNKTLAAQLFSEFKYFFPNNAVEYFVSYYDYYQPEAYIPTTGVYIEKDLSINEEIEKYRLHTTSSLLSGRKDVIVVASVSCIYGIGNPQDFHNGTINISKEKKVGRQNLLNKLVSSLYTRNSTELNRGNFRVKGDTIDIFPPYGDVAFRLNLFGDKIEEIESFNPENGYIIDTINELRICPANIFISSKDKTNSSIHAIQDDLIKQIDFFNKKDAKIEAKRIEERTNFDIEMIRELGYCSGIENYSRYFDGRKEGSRPFCLLDYFPKDYITIIDESHATLPQLRAMFGGDKSRKENLVEYGFRLPAALDNRPLRIEEFESLCSQTIYLSATPSDYELQKCDGVITEQIIRPTGLIDPEISVRKSINQIDDLLEEIRIRTSRKERILVTTLTKKMAEKFSDYLTKLNIHCRYIHSDVETLKRVQILHELRRGFFDVLIGVNLLREGLDLPEVSLVAIMDADKEGFLRSEKSLTQTAGRAARNINGLVIMYADKITNSMKKTIQETKRRRSKQLAYNKKNGITPSPIIKDNQSMLTRKLSEYKVCNPSEDVIVAKMNKKELQENIKRSKKQIKDMVKEMNFIEAAKLRDYIFELENQLNK